MALLVQHILRHPSGRVSFRRQYPPELRPFIPGPNGTGPTVLKVSLGQEGMVDALQGHAASTTARTYGAPTIAAKAEAIAKYPRFVVDE